MIFERWDVIAVPFPFTDQARSKRRPALVLSHQDFHNACGHVICAMITSAQRSAWATDIAITDLQTAGLKHASLIRFKLFTLDTALPLAFLGRLTAVDQAHVLRQLHTLLPSGGHALRD